MATITPNKRDLLSRVELRHIRYFLTLARELHYARAAAKLFISQSGLSKQIMQMESLLGTRLFERNKKQVRLTPSGLFLQQRLGNFQGYLNGIFEQLQLIEQGIEGEVKIGFVGSAMTRVVPEVMIRAKERFPGIVFSLFHMANQMQLEKLSANELDFCFTRIGDLQKHQEKVVVSEDTFSLVLPSDHPIDSIHDDVGKILALEDFIFFDPSYSPDYHAAVSGLCEALGFKPRRTHNSGHPYSMFRLVESGLGICMVPSSIKQGFDLGIKFIELDQFPQRARLYAVWDEQNTNPCFSRIREIIHEI